MNHGTKIMQTEDNTKFAKIRIANLRPVLLLRCIFIKMCIYFAIQKLIINFVASYVFWVDEISSFQFALLDTAWDILTVSFLFKQFPFVNATFTTRLSYLEMIKNKKSTIHLPFPLHPPPRGRISMSSALTIFRLTSV